VTGAAVRPWELEDDRELLSAFRRGETAALERVYRNYAPSVEALLRSGFSYDRSGQRARVAGLASAFDVEDRVHEVFARAFRRGDARATTGWARTARISTASPAT
jgi:phytoene dehydrogenase-like protein